MQRQENTSSHFFYKSKFNSHLISSGILIPPIENGGHRTISKTDTLTILSNNIECCIYKECINENNIVKIEESIFLKRI